MEYSLYNPHHSLWHQPPFHELQQNIQALLTLTEEEKEACNYSFTQRAEAYYQKKAELVRRIRYMHKLYSLLSEHYLPSPDSTPESTVEDPPNLLEEHEVSRLLEDCGRHLSELARRNDEKRETIRELRYRVEQLERENKTLRDDEKRAVKGGGGGGARKECAMMVSRGGSCCRRNGSQFGRLKELIFGSIIGKSLNDFGRVWE